MNDLLRQWLEAPFLDWDDAKGFHDRLRIAQWSEFDNSGAPSDQMAAQSRCLFQTIIPELLPKRIEDVVRFLRKRRAVRSLREELWNCLRSGENVSKEWMLRFHEEATKAQIRAEDRGRVIKWIGRAASLILPGFGLVSDVILSAAEDGADKGSERASRARFDWYYVLQRLKM